MSNPYPPFNPQDGYGQSPYAQYQPPPSTAMATWALVLSFIPFLPTILTSVGLAIAALVRSRNGSNFGRRRAIVALVIDALWFVGFDVLVVLIVLGKIDIDDTKRDAEGHVIEANVTTVDALKVGDCFDQEDTLASGGDSDPVRVDRSGHADVELDAERGGDLLGEEPAQGALGRIDPPDQLALVPAE